MFGINAAPKIYQHVIQQTLYSCENATNISDDVIVHAKNVDEHNRILEKVLKTLKEQRQAFSKLKAKLTEAKSLAYFDKNAKTRVIIDASPVGLGAVLAQEKD